MRSVRPAISCSRRPSAAGVLLRQLGADLADLPAELAESLLHVGQNIAVAPVGIPDLAGDPLQRVLQAGGAQAWDGASLGRTTGWVLAWSEDDMAVPLGPESAGRGTARSRQSQRGRSKRSGLGFGRAGGGVREARDAGTKKAALKVAIRRKVSVKSASAVDCARIVEVARAGCVPDGGVAAPRGPLSAVVIREAKPCTHHAFSFSAIALALLIGAAPDADQAGGRYRMTPAEGGAFLRLDTQTGAMSVCQRKDGRWACEAVPDERRALETEIDRLKERE